MKKVIYLLFLLGSFVYGQEEFANCGFEDTTCINDCSVPNGQMTCVDGWWSDYISEGVTPLKNINCEPNLVCNGDNSIFLMSTSSAPGSSIRTNNPFFGMNLQTNPTINLTVNRSSQGHHTGGIKVVGKYAGQNNWDVVGFGAPNNSDVCENIGIILDTSVSNYEELSFNACTATGTCHGGVGNYIVVDDIKVGGDIINIEDNCGILTVAIDPSFNLNDNIFAAVVTDSNGNEINAENNTGAPLTFNINQIGSYNVEAYISYEVNGQFEFLMFELTHTVTSISPLPITISANGTPLTDLTYTIPCGENCVTLSATNLENAVYNTTSNVFNDSNGLFCVKDSSITSFIANITGFDSCGDPYNENVLIKIDQDCCLDEPYVEPHWDECDSNNVCELESWPVRVLDDDGSHLLLIDGYTFSWSLNGIEIGTSDILYGVVVDEEYTVEVTYPDGCVYTLTYIKTCCEEEIGVIFDECPTNEQLEIIEKKPNGEQFTSIISNTDRLTAIESYNKLLENNIKCDPCEIGVVSTFIIDADGNEITNFETINISWPGNTDGVDINNSNFVVYVDTLYTATVTIIDQEGHICIYTYDFIYNCNEDCILSAPTNLRCTVFGNTTQLRWDAVTGAIDYTLYIEPNNPKCCAKDNPISLLPITITSNVYNIPFNFNYPCFAWKVVANCEGEKTSQESNYQCLNTKTDCPIVGLEGDGGIKDKISIYPNPNNGIMNIKLETEHNNASLSIYKFDGNLVTTIDNLKTDRDNLDLNLNLTSKLTKGMYFFIFKIGKNTIRKKVIIE